MVKHTAFLGVMSEPIDFEESNFTFKAPEGAKDCGDLPCYRNAQRPVTVSCWQLDEGEIEELKNNGGKLYLLVFANGFAPTALTPHKPFAEQKPKQEREPYACPCCGGSGRAECVKSLKMVDCLKCQGNGWVS